MITDSITAQVERLRAAVPAELRALPQWVLYRLEPKPGEDKPGKVPYYINGQKRRGKQGSAADRAEWATFDDACAAFVNGGGRWSGLGVELQ